MNRRRRRDRASSLLRLTFALAALTSPACGGGVAPEPRDPAADRAPASSSPASTTTAASRTEAPAPSAAGAGEGVAQQVAVDRPTSFDLKVVVVEAPPWAQTTKRRVDSLGGGRAPRLTRISEAAQDPTADAAWFEKNGVVLPAFGDRQAGFEGPKPASLPASLHGAPFAVAIRQTDGGLVALYGAPGDGGRYVVGVDASGAPRFALDFAAFRTAPVTAPGDEQFVTQGVHWAELSGGALFVSSFHRTYAKSSGGKNAFLTAVDPVTGAILWQSAPLVSNARNFLLADGFLVAGYGFTAEPDHLFVLDAATGATLSKTPVRSGPEVLARKDGRLLVRTYDADYVFRLE